MSARRLTACRILGAFGLASVATFLILSGLAVFAAAKRGDLFPPMHWASR